MIRSMTAYARCSSHGDWGSACWEMKAVNHRYLDLAVRLPEGLHPFETDLGHKARKYLNRGRVECNLKFQPGAELASKPAINRDLLRQLSRRLEEVCELVVNPGPIDPLSVLSWPNVLQDSIADDLQSVQKAVFELFEKTLKDLVAVREREGRAIKEMITGRLDAVLEETKKVKKRLPSVLKAQQAKLMSRLGEIQGELEQGRLEQEMVFFAQRIDVSEEVDRLEAHAGEVRRVLKKGGVMGKRLDFLMQELNREANTLASKAIDVQVTQVAVELKVLIEQMREQVQNVE